MRNLAIVIFLVMMCAILAGCGKNSQASDAGTSGLTKVDGNFTYKVMVVDEQTTTVEFQPFAAGAVTDGFVILYNGKQYFLAEGQKLTLKTNQQYNLDVHRAFMTDNGLLLVSFNSFYVGAGRSVVNSDTLNLPQVERINGWLLTPRVIANFTKGNIAVSNSQYMAPPSKADEVEVTFSAFIRASLPPIIRYGAVIEGVRTEFKLPADSAYNYASAVARFNDPARGRVIVSESSPTLEFDR